MILITGATGHLGNAVANLLLKKTDRSGVAVLARNPDKAGALKDQGVEIRRGDYDDYNSLVTSFRGIEKLYFVSGNDVKKRGLQHENVINAAKEAGIKYVVYTSFQRKNETETSPLGIIAKAHIDTEKTLKNSGISYTILMHNIYSDMLPLFMGENVLDTKTIFVPAGDGKTAYASRTDMAEAAVNILTGTGHENRSYEISGNEALSFGDIAALLAELSGKEITYVSPSKEEFISEMKKYGLPDQAIATTVSFAEAMKQGELDSPGQDLESLLGRKPVSVRTYLKEAYKL